jgi:hypothetical protein
MANSTYDRPSVGLPLKAVCSLSSMMQLCQVHLLLVRQRPDIHAAITVAIPAPMSQN